MGDAPRPRAILRARDGTEQVVHVPALARTVWQHDFDTGERRQFHKIERLPTGEYVYQECDS